MRGVSRGSRTIFALMLCASLLTASAASAGPFQRTPPKSKIKRLIVWVMDLIDLPKP